eukprot:410799_1
MPTEYCRYHPKYDKCLAWMKSNQPELFTIEISDITKRDPKTAKKAQYLWDDTIPSPEEKQSAQAANKKKKQALKHTAKAKTLENEVKTQQQISTDQMSDIAAKFAALSTKNNDDSPSKSILKNRENPNLETERQRVAAAASIDNSDEELDQPSGAYLGRGGNRNKARGPPPRKDTKQKKRKKKGGRDRRRKSGREEEEQANEENKDNNEEEKKPKVVRFYEQNRNKKVPKNIVEVSMENRKGNKRVTVVRGFIEKSKDKDQRIKSEFRKKFATSVNITFQNPGSEKGPKQVILMGDKRYDFMRYLKEKFPSAGKLLYYKSKRFGLTPAVDPNLGFVSPPP